MNDETRTRAPKNGLDQQLLEGITGLGQEVAKLTQAVKDIDGRLNRTDSAISARFNSQDSQITAIRDQQVESANSLSELKQLTSGVNDRLDKLNGSVEKDKTRITDLEMQVASRNDYCPLVEDVRKEIIRTKQALEVKTAREDAASKQNSVWTARLVPLVRWLAYIIAAGAVGYHGRDIVGLFGK